MPKASQNAVLGKPHQQRGSITRKALTESVIGKPTSKEPLKTN